MSIAPAQLGQGVPGNGGMLNSSALVEPLQIDMLKRMLVPSDESKPADGGSCGTAPHTPPMSRSSLSSSPAVPSSPLQPTSPLAGAVRERQFSQPFADGGAEDGPLPMEPPMTPVSAPSKLRSLTRRPSVAIADGVELPALTPQEAMVLQCIEEYNVRVLDELANGSPALLHARIQAQARLRAIKKQSDLTKKMQLLEETGEIVPTYSKNQAYMSRQQAMRRRRDDSFCSTTTGSTAAILNNAAQRAADEQQPSSAAPSPPATPRPSMVDAGTLTDAQPAEAAALPPPPECACLTSILERLCMTCSNYVLYDARCRQMSKSQLQQPPGCKHDLNFISCHLPIHPPPGMAMASPQYPPQPLQPQQAVASSIMPSPAQPAQPPPHPAQQQSHPAPSAAPAASTSSIPTTAPLETPPTPMAPTTSAPPMQHGVMITQTPSTPVADAVLGPAVAGPTPPRAHAESSGIFERGFSGGSDGTGAGAVSPASSRSQSPLVSPQHQRRGSNASDAHLSSGDGSRRMRSHQRHRHRSHRRSGGEAHSVSDFEDDDDDALDDDDEEARPQRPQLPEGAYIKKSEGSGELGTSSRRRRRSTNASAQHSGEAADGDTDLDLLKATTTSMTSAADVNVAFSRTSSSKSFSRAADDEDTLAQMPDLGNGAAGDGFAVRGIRRRRRPNSINVPNPSMAPKKPPKMCRRGSTGAREGETPAEVFALSRKKWGSFKEWEIPHSQIIYEKRIGAGSFGTVYKGHWHGTVAIKRLNVTNPDEAQLEAFRNEVSVLRKTRHANVLLFMGACTTLPDLAIITRWCDGLSLYNHLHVEQREFSMQQLLDMSKQMAQGMDYLHAKNIIHRDLKSNNILLSQSSDKNVPNVQIADFGLATVKAKWVEGGGNAGPAGSILWMAPEIIVMKPNTNPYTAASDVYAFGVVLYEVFSSTLPYPGCSAEQIMYMVGRGLMSPDMSRLRADTPQPGIKLMQRCLKREVSERPTIGELLKRIGKLIRATPVLQRSGSDTVIHAKDGNQHWTPRPLSLKRKANLPNFSRLKMRQQDKRTASGASNATPPGSRSSSRSNSRSNSLSLSGAAAAAARPGKRRDGSNSTERSAENSFATESSGSNNPSRGRTPELLGGRQVDDDGVASIGAGSSRPGSSVSSRIPNSNISSMNDNSVMDSFDYADIARRCLADGSTGGDMNEGGDPLLMTLIPRVIREEMRFNAPSPNPTMDRNLMPSPLRSSQQRGGSNSRSSAPSAAAASSAAAELAEAENGAGPSSPVRLVATPDGTRAYMRKSQKHPGDSSLRQAAHGDDGEGVVAADGADADSIGASTLCNDEDALEEAAAVESGTTPPASAVRPFRLNSMSISPFKIRSSIHNVPTNGAKTLSPTSRPAPAYSSILSSPGYHGKAAPAYPFANASAAVAEVEDVSKLAEEETII